MKKRGYVALGLAALMTYSLGAATGTEVKAYIQNIKVMNTKGTENVEALSYNNNVYLPIQQISELTGTKVDLKDGTYLIGDVTLPEATQPVTKVEDPVVAEVYNRANPAPLNTMQTLTKDGCTYEITVINAIRGDAAWKKIKNTNIFNEPASDNTEYVLAYIEFKYISGNGPKGFGSDLYSVFSGDGERERTIGKAIAPNPSIHKSINPGESIKGYIVLVADKNDKQPKLGYGYTASREDGIWFKLYK